MRERSLLSNMPHSEPQGGAVSPACGLAGNQLDAIVVVDNHPVCVPTENGHHAVFLLALSYPVRWGGSG